MTRNAEAKSRTFFFSRQREHVWVSRDKRQGRAGLGEPTLSDRCLSRRVLPGPLFWRIDAWWRIYPYLCSARWHRWWSHNMIASLKEWVNNGISASRDGPEVENMMFWPTRERWHRWNRSNGNIGMAVEIFFTAVIEKMSIRISVLPFPAWLNHRYRRAMFIPHSHGRRISEPILRPAYCVAASYVWVVCTKLLLHAPWLITFS